MTPSFRAFPTKRDAKYVPNYAIKASYINERHTEIASAVEHIPGWLSQEDILKLYELAYFSTGSILEIGTYCGRSTVVMATALADAASEAPIVSLDIDAHVLGLAARTTRAHQIDQHVLLVCDTASDFLRMVPEYSPTLVFIDGDHSLEAVHQDLAALAGSVQSGCLLLFHDYVPEARPEIAFGVPAAPMDVAAAIDGSWLAEQAQFAGVYGCCGLFQIR